MRLFRSIALNCLVLAVLTGCWMAVIAWNWQRVQALCGPGPDSETRCEHLLMGSDAAGAGEIFRNFPSSVTELRRAPSAAIFVDTPKHPAYGPVSAAANVVASQVFRLHYPVTMYFVSALYASGCSLLLYRLLCMVGAVWPMSLMLTAIATLSSAWVSVFSLPETYAFSVLALIVTLCSGVALRSARADRRRYLLVMHVAVTGLASWAYLPIAGAVCFVLESVTSLRAWRQLMLCSAIVVCVSLVPQIRLGGVRQVGEQFAYATAWGSVHHLVNVPTWRDVGSAISVFSVIFPATDPLTSPGSIDWAAVRPLRTTFIGAVVLASIYLGFIGAVIWECRRNAYLSVTLLWMALMVVFHVYFNPREVLLYLSVPMTLVVFMAGTLQAGRTRVVPAVLAVVLAVEALNWVSFVRRLAGAV